ncbi:hypothetical protein [Bacillus cereus group sp. TH152-1LC]|uniref:hypothetical protein n=1 Tax=Bacillus cereus group sp. TH152-1LC TaxID=3018060 RepID=UPI0022E080F3|nr:hypothetical protein [Bacillus cereus group sp. TH152-1LC]MDA1675190.1 hypothetical protein [Bacillus cereus group sp. TH152-1LC]
MTNKGLKNIELMNDLITQSNEIVRNHVKEMKNEKQELLEKSMNKLHDFFQDVLHSLPFHMINVTLNRGKSNEICFLIRKNSNSKNTYLDLLNHNYSIISSDIKKFTEKEDFVVFYIKNGYSTNYFSLDKDCVGKYWGTLNNKIHKPIEQQIVLLVKNLNTIKEEIQNAILSKQQEELKRNDNFIQTDTENLGALQAFIKEN